MREDTKVKTPLHMSSRAGIVLVFNCFEDKFSDRRSSRVTELCTAEQS